MGEIKKKVYEDFRGNRDLYGFTEALEWRRSADGAPAREGEYLCSNGDGNVFKMEFYCGRVIFDELMCSGHVTWDDGTKLTDSDFISVYRSNNIWLNSDEIEDEWGEYVGIEYVLCKQPPKYYAVSTITGPIDEEDYGEPLVEKDLSTFLVYTYGEHSDELHETF